MSQGQISPSRTRFWAPLAVVVAAAVAGTIVTVAVLTTGNDKTSSARSNPFLAVPATKPATKPVAPLKSASVTCTAGTLADENKTLLIDMEGVEYGSGEATIDDIVCVLAELDAPQSIMARMESTRALDGMQTADWSGFEATWTYHPDDGLDLILTQTD